MRHAIASAIALIALSSTAAHARNAHDEACATLSPQAEAVEFRMQSSNRYLLIRDGDAHYRLDLFRTDSVAPMAAPIRVVSSGQARTLCTRERTVVKAADGRVFWVYRASAIDAEQYAKLTRGLAKTDSSAWQASLSIGD